MKPKTYATATAFRRALEDRLAAVTKAEGVDLQRIRRHVAFDRLLSRLFAEQNAPWVLKGGYALELKLATAHDEGQRSRPRPTAGIGLRRTSHLRAGTAGPRTTAALETRSWMAERLVFTASSAKPPIQRSAHTRH